LNREDNKLNQAVNSNDINKVKLLLNKEKKVSSFSNHINNYAIIIASKRGNIDIVKLLLKDKRFDLSESEFMAFRYASQYGHIEVIKLLLKQKGIKINTCENYAIVNAFINKHTSIVNLLWQYEIIKNTLKKDKKELYNNLIKQDIKNKIETF
jgi:ankyrin repeat protein